MAGITLEVEVRKDGTVEMKNLKRALDGVGDEAAKTGKKGSKALARMTNAARKTGRAVAAISGKLALVAAGIAAVATAGMGLLIRQGIQFNATLEATRTQFGVIYGDVKRAGRAMKELVEFAARTPYGLAELANSAKILEAFGIGGKDNLRMVGDAAAAAQRPLEEVAMTFGRIKSGAFGEAFMRLAEMGLATREMLEAEGLVFNRSGSYIGSVDDAMSGIARIMNRRFQGMMDKLADTWNGKISTMKDAFSIMAGDLMRPLFDKMKPRIDQLISLFDKIGKSPAARVFFAKVADWADMMAGKILDWLADFPRVFQWILAIIEGFEVLWDSIKAGATWVGNVFDATFDLIRIKALGLGQDIVTSMSAGSPAEKVAAFGARLFNRGAMQKAAEANLLAVLGSSGMRATWQTGMDKIRRGLQQDMTFDATGGEEDLGTGAGLDDPVQGTRDFLFEIQAAHEETAAAIAAIWRGTWQNMVAIARESFSDAIVANILESGETLEETLNSIWQQMKYSLVKTMVDMGIAAVLEAAKMQLKISAINKAARAEELLAAGVSAKAAGVSTGANAQLAAAKIHAAHDWIPFAGVGISQGFVTAMMASVAGAGAVGAFRSGGLVPGGGSGMEDNRTASVSGGEYVLPASAVRAVGTEFLDAVRLGGVPAGGGAGLTVNLYGGSEITEEEVEEALAPLLERMSDRGRLRVA